MSAFATESLVRLKFQLTNTQEVSATLIEDAIAEAHEPIAARLTPGIDGLSPPVAVVIGETLLAGARTLRSLAAREAATQRNVIVGGQRVETGTRHAQLILCASLAEDQAWEMLAPFLAAPVNTHAIQTTDTTPILGDTH